MFGAVAMVVVVLATTNNLFAQAQVQQLVLDTDPKEQLLTACQTGNKAEVAMALTNGADINAKDMVRTCIRSDMGRQLAGLRVANPQLAVFCSSKRRGVFVMLCSGSVCCCRRCC